MRTQKQTEASRANGARSKGPVTDQGKKFSARNAVRHGLLASTVVLETEVEDRFTDLLADLMDDFRPATAAEVMLVETMAFARWRHMRVLGAQKAAMDMDMRLQAPAVTEAAERLVFCLRASPDSVCSQELLIRYEIAFDRQFSRALKHLTALQCRHPQPSSSVRQDAVSPTQAPAQHPDSPSPTPSPSSPVRQDAVSPTEPSAQPADVPVPTPPSGRVRQGAVSPADDNFPTKRTQELIEKPPHPQLHPHPAPGKEGAL